MAFGSFYAGLAGLQANASRLGVIGNNLANSNTVGFKGSRVTFQDVFSQMSGGSFNGAGNPQQVGLGVSTAGIDLLFGQGSLQTTDLVTDVAIQGNGFFVVNDPTGARGFTRAGNFNFDKDGNLVTSNGAFVQGFTTRDPLGNIVTSGAVSNIQIPVGLTAPPLATSTLQGALNLNADAKVDDPLTTVNEAETFATTITVYDSLGASHNLTLNFTPVDTNADGVRDQWTYDVTAAGAEVAGGTAGTPFSIATGTITFDANGQLTGPTGNVTVTTPAWTNGAAAQSIDWQLFDSAGTGILTGFSGPSAVSSTTQNGYAAGRLRTLTIDNDGLMSGVFTNGVTLQLARFALATFNNPNGLLKNGANTYLESNPSGQAIIGTANTGSRGSLTANALELSNVDITQEFTDLIISERGYQANSRIITTTDQVMQEALNLKR